MTEKLYLRSKAARKLGVTAGFLKRLEREGLVVPHRDQSNRVRYSDGLCAQIRPLVEQRKAEEVGAARGIEVVPHGPPTPAVVLQSPQPSGGHAVLDDDNAEYDEVDESLNEGVTGLIVFFAEGRKQTVLEMIHDMNGDRGSKPWAPPLVMQVLEWWAYYRKETVEERWGQFMKGLLKYARAEQGTPTSPAPNPPAPYIGPAPNPPAPLGYAYQYPQPAVPARGKRRSQQRYLPTHAIQPGQYPGYGVYPQQAMISPALQTRVEAIQKRQLEHEERRLEREIQQTEAKWESEERSEMEANRRQFFQQQAEAQQQATLQQADAEAFNWLIWWDGHNKGFW